MRNHFFSTKFIKQDAAAGLVVFLVALPLCLGIAMASGAPLFSGIIAGIVGGVIVGVLSNSNLSVSGPAAGLTAIVLTAITDLGAFDAFLCAVFIAGIIQVIFGFVNAGSISNYIPATVIEGMLAGIGVIIILKQLPHALGYDADFEGDESFFQLDGSNTISAIGQAFATITPGALLISIVSLVILLLWDKHPFFKKVKIFPAALLAVLVGIGLNTFFIESNSWLAIGKEHLVVLPVPESFADINKLIISPDFSQITNKKVWTVAITLAVVASIETLLCIEAADKMDVKKRSTNTNRELKAQGAGNIVSALLGGLPLTSVLVRTSANASAGAQTKIATIIHGLLLLICVLLIPGVLNLIPNASLAAVLLLVGYKLGNPRLLVKFYKMGIPHFVPFLTTLLGVVFTDLLKGVAVGILVSMFFVLARKAK